MKFYSSVRIDIRPKEKVKDSAGDFTGRLTKIKVVKNKLAPPFRECMTEIIFGRGINTAGEVLDLAVDRGLVEKSGAWYAYGGEKIGQGRVQACAWLTENPEVSADLRSAILNEEGEF